MPVDAFVPSAGSTMLDRSRARVLTKIDPLASQGGLSTGLTTLSRKKLTVTVTYPIRRGNRNNVIQATEPKAGVGQIQLGATISRTEFLSPKVKIKVGCWNVRTTH